MSWSNKARRRMDVVGCKAAVLSLWGRRKYVGDRSLPVLLGLGIADEF